MAPHTYISLFSGVGMLDIAIHAAIPGSRCVCYCEREAPASAILAARMGDGILDEAPIWSDVTTFPTELFRGRVAGIIGGFPCQDLSVAGKQAGIHGERSGLFFQICRIVRELESVEWMFLENVPPVLAFPAGPTVLGEIAAMGFDAEWGTLRASDVGPSHQRKRAFILAYRRRQHFDIQQRPLRDESERGSGDVADSEHPQWWTEHEEHTDAYRRDGFGRSGSELGCAFCGYEFDAECGRYGCPNCEGVGLADSSIEGLEGAELNQPYSNGTGSSALGSTGELCMPLFPPGPNDTATWQRILAERPDIAPAVESKVRGVVDGCANRVHRLRALGNGVVPLQAAVAFRELIRRC